MSIKWGVYGAPILSLKNYTYEDAQRLKSSGLEKILSGIESVSPKIQKIIRKPVDINDVYKVNRNFSYEIDNIKNETDQHMDLSGINDTISTKLLRSGQYRFVDMSVVKNVEKQLNYQSDSGLVNKNSRVKFGQQIGAQYMLYGNVSTITSRTSKATDVYYLFTMKLLNLKTGIVEWADQKQFRKIKSRMAFGW